MDEAEFELQILLHVLPQGLLLCPRLLELYIQIVMSTSDR